MSTLSSHVLDEIRALPPQFPDIRTAVMPALDLAQEELGYLTPEAMSEVAGVLNLDPGYVQGVATFYTLFHTEPVGKHVLYMCTNISCNLRGADALVEHTMRAIGVHEQRQVSSDGLFSVEAVECLGACEYAPVMRLDHAYHHDLTPEKIDSLVAERRGMQVPSPTHVGEGKGGGRTEQAEVRPKKPRAPRKKKADG